MNPWPKKYCRTFVILVTAVLVGPALHAQKTVWYYNKESMQVAAPDSAGFYRIILDKPVRAYGGYKFTDYYPDHTIRAFGQMLSNIFQPSHDGQVSTFYRNGKKESVQNYVAGQPSGAFIWYHPNGKLWYTGEYPVRKMPGRTLDIDVSPPIPKIVTWFDPTGVQQVVNGNGVIDQHDPDSGWDATGNIVDSLKEGMWRGRFNPMNAVFTESYARGRLVSGTATWADGSEHPYTELYRMAQLTIPDSVFQQQVREHLLQLPAPKTGKQREIVASFYVQVDSQGKPVAFSVFEQVSPEIDREVLSLLEHLTWEPARSHGIPQSAVVLMSYRASEPKKSLKK